jgi:hypothetical protein
VHLKFTQIPSGSSGATVGQTLTNEWRFTANCPATSCTLTDKGSVSGTVGQFTAKLTPANGGYQGQAANVQFSHCGGVNSYGTVVLKLYPDGGGVSNGAWTSWHGTMTITEPTQTVSDGYCDASEWDMALTGNGSL